MAAQVQDPWFNRLIGVGVGAVAPYIYRGANHVISRFTNDISSRVVKRVDDLTDRAAKKVVDKFGLIELSKKIRKRKLDNPFTRAPSRRRRVIPATPLIIENGDGRLFNRGVNRRGRADFVTEAPLDDQIMDILEDVPINKAYFPLHKSFYKMPKRFKRRGAYKRGRRRKKAVTKRGVKALIQKNAMFAGSWNKYRVSDDYYLSSTYGNHVVGTLSFNTHTHLASDYVNYIYKVANVNPVTAGTDQAQHGGKYQAKGGKVKVMMHNPLTEIVIATFWWIRPKEHGTVLPSTLWSTEYAEYAPNTVSVYNKTFTNDFQTYPTEFPEWRKKFDILQKYNVVFRPGDYREMYLKLPSFTFDYQELEGTTTYKANISRHLMIQLKGIPTMQNQIGPDPSNVNYTLTHLEMIFELEYQLVPLANTAASLLASTIARGTVTAAKSLIPESSSTIQTV